MWIIWALISAVFVACRRTFEKKLIGEINQFTYGFLIQIISLPVITIATLLAGKFLNPFALGAKFWVPIIISSICFYPLNTLLYQHAIKNGEYSKVLPLQSLWPVFSLVLALITFREIPTFVATVGVLLTVLGIYALGLKGRRLHHPLQPFREDSASRAMLAGVLLVALAGVVDKAAIQASSPLFYSFSASIGAMIVLFLVTRFTNRPIWVYVRPYAKQLATIGTLQGITYTTYLLAIAAGPIAYVSALRGSNILFGSILGIVLFKEKFTKAKLISFTLIVSGSVLLAAGA